MFHFYEIVIKTKNAIPSYLHYLNSELCWILYFTILNGILENDLYVRCNLLVLVKQLVTNILYKYIIT